jgi:hypothetical protein
MGQGSGARNGAQAMNGARAGGVPAAAGYFRSGQSR